MFEPIKKRLNNSLMVASVAVGLILGALINMGVPMTFERASSFEGILKGYLLGLLLIGTYMHEQNNRAIELIGAVLMVLGIVSGSCILTAFW